MVMEGGEAMDTGLKAVSRKSFVQRFFSADYIDVPANAQILKLLSKQGDRQVLFADNVMKLNRSSKLVRRVLIITEVAMYILDSDFYRMRHRFALQASFYLMDEDDASVALASGISWLTDTYTCAYICMYSLCMAIHQIRISCCHGSCGSCWIISKSDVPRSCEFFVMCLLHFAI
jgi:hypothetical protein